MAEGRKNSDQKVILIVGATGGLGFELLKHFSTQDYTVIAHYYSSDSLKDQLREFSDYQFKADISKDIEVNRMITNIMAITQRIDVVLNAAGVSHSAMSWNQPIDDWQQTIDINLTGSFLVTKYVLAGMRSNNFGRIIHFSSVVAQNGAIGTAAYAASKAGLIGMAKSISKEVANKNITINNIALGYFNKGMINQIPEDIQLVIKKNIPKQCFGEVKELIRCIEYLSDENASYLTGQTINLNGGLYA